MKYHLLFASLLAALTAIASADPAAQPLPVDQIPIPAARPAAAPANAVANQAQANPAPATPSPASTWSTIVILPFDSLGDTDRRDWVIRALQNTLSTETARLGRVYPISAPAPADGSAIDTKSALDTAKTYSGDVVIFGAIQFTSEDVRFTGQVVDVKTGAAIAGLKASGDFRDLFALEDILSSQLARALRPPPVAVAGANPQSQSAIFTQPAPGITAADLYTPFDDQTLFASDYNRFYLDQAGYSNYLNGGYGYGFGYPGIGYGIGYYPSFYGNYYAPLGGFGYGYGYGGPGGFGGHGHNHAHTH